MAVKMSSVKSSNVSGVGYDVEARELHVTFANGSTYVYSGVDETTYRNLLESDSPGAFVHRNVRDRFTFRKE
jgi:KTSC domain-containing protein